MVSRRLDLPFKEKMHAPDFLGGSDAFIESLSRYLAAINAGTFRVHNKI